MKGRGLRGSQAEEAAPPPKDKRAVSIIKMVFMYHSLRVEFGMHYSFNLSLKSYFSYIYFLSI